VQPVATCHQSPYLHKPAIVIVTSFATELVTPTVTDERTYVTDTLSHSIYKDTLHLSISKYTRYNAMTSTVYQNIQNCNVFDNGNFPEFWGLMGGIFNFQNGNSRWPCTSFYPSRSWYSIKRPGGMQGWIDLVGWLHTVMVYPPKDSHPSKY